MARTPREGDRVTYFYRPDADAECVELEAEITGVHDPNTVDLMVRPHELVTLNKRRVIHAGALAPGEHRAGCWVWPRPPTLDE